MMQDEPPFAVQGDYRGQWPLSTSWAVPGGPLVMFSNNLARRLQHSNTFGQLCTTEVR